MCKSISAFGSHPKYLNVRQKDSWPLRNVVVDNDTGNWFRKLTESHLRHIFISGNGGGDEQYTREDMTV